MGKRGPRKKRGSAPLGIKKTTSGIAKKMTRLDDSMDTDELDATGSNDFMADDAGISLGQLKKRHVAEKKKLRHELDQMRRTKVKM